MGSAPLPLCLAVSFPSPNCNARRDGHRPSLIVLHYTAIDTFDESRAWLCDPAKEVSAHWLIDRDGRAEQLVDEADRAWHAGAGAWGGLGDVNSRSIGIELQNNGLQPFPEPQMAALEALLPQIMARWDIAPKGVIAHSDLAPERKIDPGARFDWRRLALQGLAVWPEAGEGGSFRQNLIAFGYPDLAEDILLQAFRLRFAPMNKGPLRADEEAMAAGLAQRFGKIV